MIWRSPFSRRYTRWNGPKGGGPRSWSRKSARMVVVRRGLSRRNGAMAIATSLAII